MDPSDDPHLVLASQPIQNALARFDHFGGHDELDKALEDCERALQVCSTTPGANRAANWNLLKAATLHLPFERDGVAADAEASELIFKSIMASSQIGSSTYVHSMYGLGRIAEARYDHTEGLQYLETSCEFYRKARAAAMPNEPHDPLYEEIAVHLGRILRLLSMKADGKAGVTEAIIILSEVIQNPTTTDPVKACALAYLSFAHIKRWLDSGREKEDLLKSEESIDEALLLGHRHRHHPRFLRIFVAVCLAQDRLKEAISAAEQALDLLEGTPSRRLVDRRSLLHSLAMGYGSVFQVEGRLEDLSVAVKHQRLLVSDSGSASVPHFHFDNLCLYLCMLFETSGRLIDIDDAIEAGEKAMQLGLAIGSHVDYTRNNLGRAYYLRFLALGEQEDFKTAQIHLETGIKNHVMKSLYSSLLRRLANLYDALLDEAVRSEMIDSAVEAGTDAVALARKMKLNETPQYCSEQGARLLRRFELRRDSDDLRQSILMHKVALESASPTFHERHAILCRHGQALRRRFEVDGNYQDSERSAELLLEAWNFAVAAHLPQQSLYAAELAALYAARHASFHNQADLQMAIEYYDKGASASEGFTRHRFQAAVAGARLSQGCGRFGQATELFSTAIALLPRIAWLGLNADKRHAQIVQTASQLPCDAAASAIRAGQWERAVELLDEGRSVVWRSILELRTDLRDLKAVAPELARQLLEVAQELEHEDMSTRGVSEEHKAEVAIRRRRAAERWEGIISRVREIAGFGSFLKPSPFSVLRQAARDGPVIFLNVSRYGSDALIVSSTEAIRTIPLPGLDLGTIHRLAYVLYQALRVPRDHSGHNIIENVLVGLSRQLWFGGIETVAKSIMGGQRQSFANPHRVWWVPTGFLSLLPLHCAGPYHMADPGIPDFFISSYTTTLSALLRAREAYETRIAHSDSLRMLVIGLEETPGLPRLPSTSEEMKILANIPFVKGNSSFLCGRDATVKAITHALPNYNWVHASCHGSWDPMQPLKSAFNLTDGSMELSDIVRLQLGSADFAFLSACHTARHTTFVPDESMHVVAALQIAGFRGVLGTAWSMADKDGPRIAERFYWWLTFSGRNPQAQNAAEALHMAIKDLRRSGLPLHRWGAFVHFGI